MQLGDFKISVQNFGYFRLDGGSMFGSVPKNLWAKRITPDDENCISLVTRSLIIDHGKRRYLIDVGMGEKWKEKQREIYGLRNIPQDQWIFDPLSVTDLILTHLHFDHAGGISHFGENGDLELCFPKARVYLQTSNWDNANHPTLKERASYLKENVQILDKADLTLVDGDTEIYPGIKVHRVDGHTRGQQWIEIRAGGEVLMYATDLIPTSHHLPLPFHMGYDSCAETLMREKEAFLSFAVRENAIVVFEHDPAIAAARIHIDEKGHYGVREVVEL